MKCVVTKSFTDKESNTNFHKGDIYNFFYEEGILKYRVASAELSINDFQEHFKVAMGSDYDIDVSDTVNHPKHYTGKYECIEVMLDRFGKEEVKTFCKLNAFKYLWRSGVKHSSPEEDIKKANWYLNKYIEL